MSAANESIPRFEPGQRITFKASGAVTGKRLVAVTGLDDEGVPIAAHCPAGGKADGVATYDVANGGYGTMVGSGVVTPIDPAVDIPDGELVMSAANGQVTIAGETTAEAATVTVGATNSKVMLTAVEEGAEGNAITITITDPPGNNVALSVDVDGTAIEVIAATDGSSAITSTAAQVIAAINEDNDASQLVVAENGAASNGTGVVAAAAATPLTGGTDAAGENGAVIGKAWGGADESDGEDALVKLY
jgi:hypothetical protein